MAHRRAPVGPSDRQRPAPASERTARKPEASTRARILASAERLFAERGFSDVTMPMIARASGITAGAIYKHFDSKVALFFEVLRAAVESTVVAADGWPGGTALPKVVAGFTTHERKRFRQLAIEIHSASLKHPEVRLLLRRSVDREIEQISGIISATRHSETLDPTDRPELLASAVMVFIMGLMHMETLVPQLVGKDEWADVVARCIALLLRAPGPATPSSDPKEADE